MQEVSLCTGAPAVLGWAPGSLGEPRNDPQLGMANMRAIMPASQRAVTTSFAADGLQYASVATPKQQRETRIVKDAPADQIASEIMQWQSTLHFMTHLNQVGQTGSSPRHPKGSAACCHGEAPHTVGWRFIGERRAINLDPNCG